MEPKYRINSFEVFPNSGIILAPNNSPQIGQFFIPALGKAPQWCSYIENLTEEMEEQQKDNVYDEFRFLSKEDLEKVNGGHLIGTKFVKSYMQGFVIKAKFYEKLRAEAQPFDLEEHKKKKLEERLEREMKDKIYVKGTQRVKGYGKKANLNEKFLDLVKQRMVKVHKKGVDEENYNSFMEDDRFTGLKNDQRFKVDIKDEEFLLRNPSMRKGIKKGF